VISLFLNYPFLYKRHHDADCKTAAAAAAAAEQFVCLMRLYVNYCRNHNPSFFLSLILASKIRIIVLYWNIRE
jgi:hypothetical protein